MLFTNILDHITVYGIMIASGVLIAGIWGCAMAKRHGFDVYDVIITETYALVFGLIVCKLLYLVVSFDKIEWSRLGEYEYLMSILSGGFVFYGGLIGGAIGVLFTRLIHKIPSGKILELMIPGLAFAQGLGRIGCYNAGCCYGVPYDGIFHVIYHNNPFAPEGVALFPVQLAETAVCFVLAVVLGIYVFKNGAQLTSVLIYMYGYGSARFLLEFLRYDAVERGIYSGLSTSQWISLGLIITATAIAIYSKLSKNHTKKSVFCLVFYGSL